MDRLPALFVLSLLVNLVFATSKDDLLPEENRIRSNNEWPLGNYCILKGSDPCPLNFETNHMRLSVQQKFTTEERRVDGSPAIQLASFGESRLSSDEYDDLYSLDLVTCCRKSM